MKFAAILELKDKQTGNFLKTKVLEVLQTFSIDINNVYSITCDNGANMYAAVKEFQKDLELQKMEKLDENTDSDDDNAFDLEGIMQEFIDSLSLIRCAVHTLLPEINKEIEFD